MARNRIPERQEDQGSSSIRRRPTGSSDASLARNIAQAQAVLSSRPGSKAGTNGTDRRGKRRQAGGGGGGGSGSVNTRDPSRLRSLLAVLLLTTLLLVLLQAFRHFHPRQASPTSAKGRQRLSRFQRSSLGRTMRSVFGHGAAEHASPSGAARVAEREQRREGDRPSADWQKYIGAMRKHFRDELNEKALKDTQASALAATLSNGQGGGGMAIVPGEEVRDHRSDSVHAQHDDDDDDEPEHVVGKSSKEAREDRKIALEELDQETLKAMFDALYGRG